MIPQVKVLGDLSTIISLEKKNVKQKNQFFSQFH